MIRTHIVKCNLSSDVADALNMESGRIYTQVMVEHWRIFRQSGRHWLSQFGAQKLNDFYNSLNPRLLTAHSIDAAQEGFYKACKTTRSCRKMGLNVKFPHRLKKFRSTTWKNTSIRKKRFRQDTLLLSLARGIDPIEVKLSRNLCHIEAEGFKKAELVYDVASRRYKWHLVIEDGCEPNSSPGDGIMAVDLGEIHPAVVTDGEMSVVFSCREMRAVKQYNSKRKASMQSEQSRHKKGSRRWKRIQRRRNRFSAQQANRIRDLEHKVSRALVDYAVDREIGTLAIGDVRTVGDGKRMRRKSQQKISNWAHGRMRRYIGYKAEAAGIEVVDTVDEAYSSQTCPQCGWRYKPRGRSYLCPACGFAAHRDVVGAINILSRFMHGDVGKILPPEETKYRHPVIRGKRSRPDTAQVARRIA